MVAISLTHDSVKEMANRLRQFLADGGTSIKQTHAYEALAKSFGYRDWNTLLGTLQSAPAATTSEVPATLLLIDRHAMAAHGVTVAQIEAGFRREAPGMLEKRVQCETLCHEQLPLRDLPRFRPPVISVTLRVPEKLHVHDAVMDCVTSVAQPKWTHVELGERTLVFTFFLFPEADADQLVPRLREALTRLPAEIAVQSVERTDPSPDHPAFGNWRTNGVSYFVWTWDVHVGLLDRQQQLAAMALKFNGDTLVRLRDVASLHAIAK